MDNSYYDPDTCLTCYLKYYIQPADKINICYRCIVLMVIGINNYRKAALDIQSKRDFCMIMHEDWFDFGPHECCVCDEYTNTLCIAMCEDHGGC